MASDPDCDKRKEGVSSCVVNDKINCRRSET